MNAPITASDDYDVTFVSPCDRDDLTTISVESQTNPAADQYTGVDFKFTYNPFTVEPSYCALDIQCDGVSPENAFVPCQDLDGSD